MANMIRYLKADWNSNFADVSFLCIIVGGRQI